MSKRSGGAGTCHPRLTEPKRLRPRLPFATVATPIGLVKRARKHHVKGLEFAKAERWEEAAREFDAAVRDAPDQPDFNFALGGALSRLGRIPLAIEAYKRELAILPGDGPALAELGVCLARSGRLADAILCLQTVTRHRRDMPYAEYNLGLALLTDKRCAEAIEALDRAIEIDPTYANAYRVRGLAHATGGDEEQSAVDLHAAAAIEGKNHEGMLAAGSYFNRAARDLEAGQLFEMAARIAPDIALPQSIFGQFLIANRRYELGMSFVDRALALDPMLAEAHVARGFGFLGQGRVSEAVACYRRASQLKPTDAFVAGTLLFALQHEPGVTRAALREEHTKWGAIFRTAAPKKRANFTNEPTMRKLRIGIVSGDMRKHAVTFLTLRAFERLAAIGHSVYCYKTDRKFKDDEYSDRYKAFASFWRDVSDLDDAAFAALVEEQKIDVLFDLSGHTMGNRLGLFARRAAPVQLSWAGYVGTIGLDTYDGLIADPVEVPAEHDESYIEPVVRLPDCYVCYEPPREAPEVGLLPYFSYESFTFGCFNRPAKLNAQLGEVWARILESVPNSRILLVYGGLGEAATAEAVYTMLERGGVQRDRLQLLGDHEQSALLRAYSEEVDLALDPFPYSGGVTTLEAMWMGVPTVTLVGDTFAGRHSATHLTAAGLRAFCAHSLEEYIELAVSWARRPEELAALRAGLRERVAASPLNDAERFGRNLDEAVRRLWRDWCDLRLERMAGLR
ncbi:MAG TPA: tetratricopeptide repeat protein [Methylosinus sp.]|uniref:O-linked N-acetylglucosamine transferase, SPINDLY family protein n=1 Tax=Methylosinus sp. TaxID=427 RepID=UPI002F94E385